jgi:replication factor C subunit 1
MAFQKASAVVATKGGKKEQPDVEDAFEDSDAEVAEDVSIEDEDEEDITKDKMIKAKTSKGKGKATAGPNKAAPKKPAAPKKGKK